MTNNVARRAFSDQDLSCLFAAPRFGTLISPWPAHDIIDAAEHALTGIFKLPHVGIVDFSNEHRLNSELGVAENSKRLWLDSLPFVDDLVLSSKATGESRYFQGALSLFADYWQWACKGARETEIAFGDEHAVANRGCVISRLINCISGNSNMAGRDIKLLLLDALISHGDWLSNDINYATNIHRTMMYRSLLQLAILVREIDKEKYDLWMNTEKYHFLETINKSFNSIGLNTEYPQVPILAKLESGCRGL